jgi:hypothetical protein
MPDIDIDEELDAQPLREAESGPYEEMKSRPNPDKLMLMYVPSLSALLERARTLKEQELTAQEKARIACVATVVAASPAAAEAMKEERGYDDLDPEILILEATQK